MTTDKKRDKAKQSHAKREEKKDDVAFDPRFPASDPAKVKVVKMPQKPKVKKDF